MAKPRSVALGAMVALDTSPVGAALIEATLQGYSDRCPFAGDCAAPLARSTPSNAEPNPIISKANRLESARIVKKKSPKTHL